MHKTQGANAHWVLEHFHPTTQFNQVIAAAVLDTYLGRYVPSAHTGIFDRFAKTLSLEELEKARSF
ncbi:MAG: hypothetical protein AAGA91_17080 [Pseudomonadota bacterium]